MACIFCILKDLINSNLHKLAETPLSRCFSACCGKNPLIALSDSLFCAKWIHTAVYAHIFRKYFFLLPERLKHLPPQPTQAYRKEICRFFCSNLPKIPRQNALGASHFAYYMVRKHRQLSEKQLTDPRRPTHWQPNPLPTLPPAFSQKKKKW